MKKLHLGRRKVVILLAVVILSALFVAIFVRNNNASNTESESQPRLGCIDDEVGRVLASNTQIFYTSELKTLQELYDRTIKIPEDIKSASCYYVETLFLVNTGQLQEARNSYDKLRTVYDKEGGYPVNIKSYAMGIEELKSMLDRVDAEVERRKQNFNGTPIEESEKVNASMGQ